MIHQSIKSVLFSGVRLISWPMYAVYRPYYQWKVRASGPLAVHLGCGPEYIEGMVNIDGNILRKIDLWYDVRCKLPFPESSVSFVYSCHMLEHLYPTEALRLLGEIQRVLTDDGEARFAVPSMEHALRITRGSKRSTWPRQFEEGLGQAINYLFCDGQHKYGYSAGVFKELSGQVGLSVGKIDGPLDRPSEPYTYNGYKIPGEPSGSLVVNLLT